MIRKYHNHAWQINPRHREEAPQNINSNKISEKNNKSKAINSFFLVKRIAKQERTPSNAYQTKDQHKTPANNGRNVNNKSTIHNNCLRTDSSLNHRGRGGGVKCILLVPNRRPVVKTQTLFSSHGGLLANAIHHHRETT